MYFYIIKTSLYCKIGISDHLEKRLKQHQNDNGIIDKKIFPLNGIPNAICNFAELSTIQHFFSESEYIQNGNFTKICNYVENLLSNIVYHYYYLNPLHTELCCINDLYYDFKPVTQYANFLREKEGKNCVKVNDFVKTKQCKEFNKVICKNKNIGNSIITKNGMFGSTYGTAEMLFDFIISSSLIGKYEMLNWSISNSQDYKNFVNPSLYTVEKLTCKTPTNLDEAVRIALENN